MTLAHGLCQSNSDRLSGEWPSRTSTVSQSLDQSLSFQEFILWKYRGFHTWHLQTYSYIRDLRNYRHWGKVNPLHRKIICSPSKSWLLKNILSRRKGLWCNFGVEKAEPVIKMARSQIKKKRFIFLYAYVRVRGISVCRDTYMQLQRKNIKLHL